MQRILTCLAGGIFFLSGCTSLSPQERRSPAGQPVDNVIFFYTPDDMHKTWLANIRSAKKTILIEMFHLTDPEVVAELRAKDPQVDINIVLDSGNLKDPKTQQVANDLVAGKSNIHFFPSSGPPNGFNQTHTKAMVVDGETALVTSINLTNNADVQRDYGIEIRDPAVIREMIEVFNADIQNSKNSQAGQSSVRQTPARVGQGLLIWSPVTSESRLVGLIQESLKITDNASKFVYATVENLGDANIMAALSSAANAGVRVQIIVPQCVLGANGARNYTLFQYLKNGVEYRVMPHPSSTQQPYMHGKMLTLGNGRTYIGSVNYSTQSTQKNRELGIIFTASSGVAQRLQRVFEGDWSQALPVADPTNMPNCPTTATSPTQ